MFTIEDGIYRINKSDFIQAGINVDFDPRSVKVFYKGSQVPIFFQGESDGVFDDTDYFDFYATRNYGGPTNTYYDNNGVMSVDYVTNEYYDMYSDTNVYWIGWNGNFGLRFPSYTFNSQIDFTQNYFLDKIHFEQDKYYSMGETIDPASDFRYFNTEKVTGEGWFWISMFANTTVSSTFTTPHLSPNQAQCTFRIFAFPNSQDSSVNEHRIVLKVNNTTINTLTRTHYNKFDTTVTFSSSLLSPSGTNTISATYTPNFTNQNLTPNVNFDLMEIQYPRVFKFDSSRISFGTGSTDTVSKVFRVTGMISSNPISIYDIQNNYKITSYSIDGDTLFFCGKGNGSFRVINKYITKKPQRIIQKQVPDLVSSSNAADYIVIYYTQFSSQAEQLRVHRNQFDNFRSVKADIGDITDIFNFGITNPAAIRNFLGYAYNSWQKPSVAYACLLGRGSLDPKNNLNSPFYYEGLIPVYGNPQSDGFFGNIRFGSFTYNPQIAIGRLPAYTQSEAQDIVNKIIDYDNTPHDTWIKNFIMITGGGTQPEQQQFQYEGNQLIGSYLNPPPLSMGINRIYRNDSAGYVTFDYADSIKNEINRGGLIVNFIGHAASQDWEVGMHDPNILSNGLKTPLILSMTCFTGKNSIPDTPRSFGESFIYLPNKGAIGFIGSTGWSFADQSFLLNSYMLHGLSNDSLRRIGDILRYGELLLAPDSLTFTTRNTINCFGLLGDPATRILLPAIPDFDIEASDYRISDPYPSVKEPVNLTIFPKNLGTYADSCKVRFQILRNTINYSIHDTILRHFSFFDTANYFFKLDTIGTYSMKIILDPDNWYPNENKSNNILIIPIPLRNISFLPIKPVNNSVIKDDSVQIVGLNPEIDPLKNNIRIILQVDTSKNFLNPFYTAFNTSVHGVVTRFNFHLPFLDSTKVYLWRSNVTINGDSSGWSAVQRFVYNPSITYRFKFPEISTSKIDLPDKKALSRPVYDSSVIVYTSLPNQFDNTDINNIHYTGSGFELIDFTGNLSARSLGSNQQEASYLLFNGYGIYADGGQNTGLNIAKVSRLTGKLIQFKNFRMSSFQSSDSVLNFLNTFDSTQFIMVMIASYVNPSDSLHLSAKIKFRQFGSVFADSVTRFDQFDTWAFIGYFGALHSNTSEQFYRYYLSGWIPSVANLNPAFLSTTGSINFSIGPAHRWKNFSWDEILYPNSSIKYDVYGINQSLDTILIYSNLTNNSMVSLDTIKSFQYPDMRLSAKISIDTLLGLESPKFRMMNFKYTPPAEIAPDNYSFVKSDSVCQEGKVVTFSVKNYNVGYVPANVMINQWYAVTSYGIRSLATDTVYIALGVDSVRTSVVTFSTSGLKNRNKKTDTINIFFQPTILGGVNDYYSFNNFAETNLILTGDSLPPSIDVTYDGQHIINGDPISARPLIIYKFMQNNFTTYTIADTSNVYIKLDGVPVKYFVNGQPNPEIIFNPLNSQSEKVQVTYQPNLSEGQHMLQYIGRDRNGNFADTLNQVVLVSYAFTVRDLYNIPNPTKGETYFTFMLFGQSNPSSCRIKIYTVAGRLIKQINAFARIGFNNIYWDGRDQDGDYTANGVYLYKLILEDGSNTATSIQKLAILR